MTAQTQSESQVRLGPDRVAINGRSEILLCASLFYFRIPSPLWRERMEQLKAFGYNAIDVYFPWNHHEREEGIWDFTGERDVAAFLALASDAGLRVVARPGPYICSEWDGGALPAYLLAKDGIRLRDNDPVFLLHVARWYDKILPLLKRFELGASGTVVAVQLDNELDFYSCADPTGYISALRDLALGHGIRVPLIACAGQGGLTEAGGDAEDILPTCNFYPDNRDPEFETLALAYKRELTLRGLPLLVTETNRSHFLLRRLLSCGVKLLGPYLQASGTDFGFTNSINNWGKPMAFMTSDYDFGGMISPEGHVREEAYEGRLLSRVLRLYGEDLAEAAPLDADETSDAADRLEWRERGFDAGPYRLGLRGGGRLVFVSDTTRELCLMLPEAVSLAPWGVEGAISSSTAELCEAAGGEDGCVLVFHTAEDADGKVSLKFAEQPTVVSAEGADVSMTDTGCMIVFGGHIRASCELAWDDGRRLNVFGIPRRDALLLEGIDADRRRLTFGTPPVDPGGSPALELPWHASGIESHLPLPAASAAMTEGYECLEKSGIYRGFAWYSYTAAGGGMTRGEDSISPRPLAGLLAAGASDIVSLYADGDYASTVVPAGASRYLPLPAGRSPVELAARVEIWGHSNFDDPRLPALRLHATKGIRGLTAVTSERDLSKGWRYRRTTDPSPDPARVAADADDERWPMAGFGGWHPNDTRTLEYYRRTVTFEPGLDSRTLWVPGLESRLTVFVDGAEAGTVEPGDPWLSLAPWIGAEGGARQLTLALERRLGVAAGKPVLLEGGKAVLGSLWSAGERELLASASLAEPDAAHAEFPYALKAGGVAWLYASLPDEGPRGGWRATADGACLKLTAFAGDRLVGRLWLPGGEERPAMSGGSPDSFYVPGAWLQESADRRLRLLVEAVVPGQPGVLRALRFAAV
ncbi:beta-galactosidase [Cohnella hashimotonis]|uniref:Beta-galactosidase n=1 Tax=Cohnella hashimotonis TaxID=2826895 RepID=A0ABT6TJC4_9BACL|nr:beta-galactosidase [Cohnella hashimotonis]MDI4646373.1 beta-galactosidase [Cohnella hashimotonis]